MKRSQLTKISIISILWAFSFVWIMGFSPDADYPTPSSAGFYRLVGLASVIFFVIQVTTELLRSKFARRNKK